MVRRRAGALARSCRCFEGDRHPLFSPFDLVGDDAGDPLTSTRPHGALDDGTGRLGAVCGARRGVRRHGGSCRQHGGSRRRVNRRQRQRAERAALQTDRRSNARRTGRRTGRKERGSGQIDRKQTRFHRLDRADRHGGRSPARRHRLPDRPRRTLGRAGDRAAWLRSRPGDTSAQAQGESQGRQASAQAKPLARPGYRRTLGDACANTHGRRRRGPAMRAASGADRTRLKRTARIVPMRLVMASRERLAAAFVGTAVGRRRVALARGHRLVRAKRYPQHQGCQGHLDGRQQDQPEPKRHTVDATTRIRPASTHEGARNSRWSGALPLISKNLRLSFLLYIRYIIGRKGVVGQFG